MATVPPGFIEHECRKISVGKGEKTKWLLFLGLGVFYHDNNPGLYFR